MSPCFQVEAELGKSRTPSPPTIQTNGKSNPDKPNQGLVPENGFSGMSNRFPESNGHTRSHNESNGRRAHNDTNGHAHNESNGRVEKEKRTQEYLDKILPHKASDGGRIVRDILVSQQ